MDNFKKIAVTLNGKDICRIIPFNPKEGEYEIKINFCGNSHSIELFPLFTQKPIVCTNNDSNELELTYHKESYGKPPKIHLKRKTKIEGINQYQNLPLEKLHSPNVNQVFPLPLFKLEIPVSKISKHYKKKKDHKILSPKNCNVIEFYLVHKTFDLDVFSEQFPTIFIALNMLSFEVFATNSVLSNNRKYQCVFPVNEPNNVATSFELFDDMRVIANHFYDPNIENNLTETKITFIENELSEAILAMLRVSYPKSATDGEFNNIYLGTSEMRHINQPFHPLNQPSMGTTNLIEDSIKRGNLSNEDEVKYYWFAVNMRKKLLNAMNKFAEI